MIEIHSSFDIQKHPVYYQGLNDITHDSMFSLINSINKTHTLVHIHGNNGCGLGSINGITLPYVFECSYIRNDFVSDKLQNDIRFPTELDYPNIYHKEQYNLSGFPYSS